ncbi:PBECR4 domain-containing protein [Carnobacterium mobile]|uniref:PBECR4 domain-containing protein n=1 Tax=Carnobacterium mobile TaxID=2750 RepID=UPI00068E7B76|nr:PBECR4 domain-containing protein [Carnobacterium mobile]
MENVNSVKDSNTTHLLSIYNNYRKNYHGKMVTITTGYKPFSTIEITFNEKQLPHLLGLHKIDKDKASKQLTRIKNETLTYQTLKKNDNFYQIKDRIKYFSFIDDVFIFQKVKQCICVSKEDSRNIMRLDIVFLEDNIERVLNLGLRKDFSGKYAPVTFFVSKNKVKSYPSSKRAKIETLEWDTSLSLLEKSKK